MTREEQIIETAQKHGLNCMSRINYQDGFIEGAKWADKTMIEKACEWLLEKTYCHVDDRRLSMLFGSSLEMIESFHKAMEE